MTAANNEVLRFYKRMPFNIHGSPEKAASVIRRRDPLSVYPFLADSLKAGKRALDVGCGTGWVANSLFTHHRMIANGIDFNPEVVKFASHVAALLDAPSRFETADLFTWLPESPFDLVTSFGVLHHTNDCLGGLGRVLSHFLVHGGKALIGLYHLYGRAPFLEHFARLKKLGRDESELFAEFRKLFSNSVDEQMQRSWFRDQVLHPHETQHTLEEVWPVVEASGCRMISCSLDGFAANPDQSAIFESERKLGELGEERLAKGEYFPGYFLFYVEKLNDGRDG